MPVKNVATAKSYAGERSLAYKVPFNVPARDTAKILSVIANQ